MADSDCGWTCGCAGKTVKSLENTCHTWALLRWWFTTKRRYIKCMHLYLYLLPQFYRCFIAVWYRRRPHICDTTVVSQFCRSCKPVYSPKTQQKRRRGQTHIHKYVWHDRFTGRRRWTVSGGRVEPDPSRVAAFHQPRGVGPPTADDRPHRVARAPQPHQLWRHFRVRASDDCKHRPVSPELVQVRQVA